MNLDSKTAFATMNPWKLFFAVALPGMVSMFAMSIYSIIEGIFIGQTLRTALQRDIQTENWTLRELFTTGHMSARTISG